MVNLPISYLIETNALSIDTVHKVAKVEANHIALQLQLSVCRDNT